MDIIIRTFLCLTIYSHLLSITALYYEENSQLYYQQQKYIPGCWPGIEYADNGDFIIEQDITFNLECEPGFIPPFGSKTVWYCNSSNLRPSDPEKDTDDGSYIPNACVEEKLPLSIYLELEATTLSLRSHDCASYQQPSKDHTTVNIGGFSFKLYTQPFSRDCKVSFDTTGALTNVSTSYLFRLYHKPVSRYLPPGVLTEARTSLRSQALTIMGKIKNETKVEYTLKNDNSFRVDTCPEGSLVESSEVNFETNVPICRMCSVGMFMDMKLRRCMPCKVGYSDFPGATACKPCPVVMAEADRSSESITGCYVDMDSQPGRTDTIREGILFFVFFHFTLFCVVTWKIKYFHPLAY